MPLSDQDLKQTSFSMLRYFSTASPRTGGCELSVQATGLHKALEHTPAKSYGDHPTVEGEPPKRVFRWRFTIGCAITGRPLENLMSNFKGFMLSRNQHQALLGH